MISSWAEKGKIKLHEKIKTTKEEILALEEKVNAMKQKYTMMERRAEELREAEQRKHQEEISFLKKTNAQLKSDLLDGELGKFEELVETAEEEEASGFEEMEEEGSY